MATRKRSAPPTAPGPDLVGASVNEVGITTRSRALVFISHDSRDADLAEAFDNLLSDVSGGILKSFRSTDKKGTSGIEFGTEWYASIMAQLSDATDVVALLTSRSIDRPWILYEAGVAKGKLDTTVFGIALGIPLDKVSTGPFGQFQNSSDDDDSLTSLVMQLMRRNPDASPREEAIRRQVKIFQDAKISILKSKVKETRSLDTQKDDQNAAKLFEEVKAMIRELPERVTVGIDGAPRASARRTMRVDLRMVEEMFFRFVHDDEMSASQSWLLVLPIFNDYLPWLSEFAKEYGSSLKQRNLSPARRLARRMHDLIEISTTHTLSRDSFNRDLEKHFPISGFLHESVERSLEKAQVDHGRKQAVTHGPTE